MQRLSAQDAVQRVLLSNKVNYWTGDECRAFEREFAAFAGTEYAVAVANGTVALDMALRAMGIGAGDEVVVTSRTFLASASAIVNVGARPVFADVDRDSQNITAESVTAVLSRSIWTAGVLLSVCLYVCLSVCLSVL